MKAGLCRMAEILRNRDMTMEGYVEDLQRLEQRATPLDPMPAQNRIDSLASSDGERLISHVQRYAELPGQTKSD